MLETGKQIITIHLLPNTSRSKGNQIMKFDQLIEYNMRIYILKNHAQNLVEISRCLCFCEIQRIQNL